MGIMDQPILVGMLLPPDYRVDARIIATLEKWGTEDNVEVLYEASPFPTEASPFPTLGRDKIVTLAKYRVPHPTHILFVDSDVLPRHKTLRTLMNLGRDIVTGVYPMVNRNSLVWSVTKDGSAIEIPDLPRTPFKVSYCGFGIMLVKYEVFEKLEWPYWKNEHRPGQVTKGEDVYFCHKAQEAGYDIWCEPKVKCDHLRMASLLSVAKNLKG